MHQRQYLRPDQYANTAFYNLTDDLATSKETPTSPYVPYAHRVRYCHARGTTYSCKEHGLIYEPIPCHKPNLCVTCGDGLTKRLTRAAMYTFNQLSEKPGLDQLDLVKIVFTLPESVQAVLSRDNLARFSDLVARVVALYHNGTSLLDYLEASTEGGSLGVRSHRSRARDEDASPSPLLPGGMQVVHTWHSSDPILKAWYPHVHSFWTNYVQDPMTSQFHQVHSYVDIERLRLIYRAELVREFGHEADIPDRINLHCDFIPFTEENRPFILHSLKYALRKYQLDVVAYSNYYGLTEYTKEEEANIISHLVPNRRTHVVKWFGYLSRNSRKLLGIHKEPKDTEDRDELGKHVVRCPVCRCPLQPDVIVDMANLIADGTPFLYPHDPNAPAEFYQGDRG